MKNKSTKDWYRKLRTNIEYNKKYPNINSICLTSANKGSGTTTIACSLATTFLANHSKVLLIDANINKPRINKCFNIEKTVGLTDLLLNQDYQGYSRYCTNFKDEYSNNLLYVMGTGRKVKNALDLLSSGYFKEFMEAMKDQFDFILIDCPSLEDSNDVIPVGHIVDGAILVVSLPETEKNNAKKALQQLNRNGVNVIGTVLNKVE
ncbi:CpsD/CapB family tyrosine-protein kinase [Holdemanella porci]|uniref:CpsD/CapB family tyrosine-protein kinase n=1 Tax=Holdemanella porci TaxID=2652276 RepID=UPI003F8EDAD5